MRLHLVRHGETEWNADGRLQGREFDPSLSSTGLAQARCLTNLVAALAPTAVWTSPMRRAAETAAAAGFPAAAVDDRWAEHRLGEWSGRNGAEVAAEQPDEYRAWRAGRHTPPGGEPFDELRRRVAAAVADLRAGDDASAVAVFTHGGTIRAAIAELTGIDPGRLGAAVPGSVSTITVNDDGNATLDTWNVSPLDG